MAEIKMSKNNGEIFVILWSEIILKMSGRYHDFMTSLAADSVRGWIRG